MLIRVDEVAPNVTKKYPYTHRVQIDYLTDYIRVLDWITDNNIESCMFSDSQAIYLNSTDTEWLLLRWS